MATPKLLRYLEGKRSPFVPNIHKLMKKVEPILNHEIPKVFPDYTILDIGHSTRMMDYIYDLLPSVFKLSDLDITLLIYSSLLHDIGMYAENYEIEQIKKSHGKLIKGEFGSVLPDDSDNETDALQDYIRRTHAKRSAVWISKHCEELCKIPFHPEISFLNDVALICEGHTASSDWLDKELTNTKTKGDYEYNQYFCALMLRLGDILDIDSRRVPPSLMKSLKSEGIYPNEWAENIIIDNSLKIKKDDFLNRKYIDLVGKCKKRRIYEKILEYVDDVHKEIILCNESTRDWPKEYRMNLYYPVHVKLVTETIRESTFIIEYSKVRQLLRGENLYYSRKVGLREIIQNSMDACNIAREVFENETKPGELPYGPYIKVIINEREKIVTIKDNGIGMSLSTIKNYLLDIGASYYNSDDYKNEGYRFKPIARFGIGFFASLMISNVVIVKTRHYREDIMHEVTLHLGSSVVKIKEKSGTHFEGTEVILEYDRFMSVMSDADECASFVKQNFIFHNIHFEVVYADK
jgi:hypothetical protein